MAWIKRNLFFVISLAVGLALTVYCALLFWGDLSRNTGVDKEFQDYVVSYGDLQKKNPYPSKANIDRANDDASQVRGFVQEFRKAFAAFPTPPTENEKGFSAYLRSE